MFLMDLVLKKKKRGFRINKSSQFVHENNNLINFRIQLLIRKYLFRRIQKQKKKYTKYDIKPFVTPKIKSLNKCIIKVNLKRFS